MLQLITEKLTKIGMEPVIAIKERAYGQDIFCTKICGKIIESQFCIVILDDTVEKVNGATTNIPNPNVYYEYGLMTALGKHVIPLQKEGQDLAFNIQTHDTIKYTPKNISAELDRALKDATKITAEDRTGYQYANTMSERLCTRSLEISGYQRTDYEWFLAKDIEDTVFSGLNHPLRQEYLFFTIANDKSSLQDALTDAQVIIKRLETRHVNMVKETESLSSKIKELNKNVKQTEQKVESDSAIRGYALRSTVSNMRRSMDEAARKRDDLSSKLELIQNSKFAIILTPDAIELQEKVVKEYSNIRKEILHLPLYVGTMSGIQIGDFNIPFRTPSL